MCKFHQMNDECMHFDKNEHHIHILQRLLKSTPLINLMNCDILRRMGGQPYHQMCLNYNFKYDIFDHKLLYSKVQRKNPNILDLKSMYLYRALHLKEINIV